MTTPAMTTPAMTVTEGSDASGGVSTMNLAGRYQSRRHIGHAFDSILEQKLHVRTEERRGNIMTGPQPGSGRRRSIAIPEIHFEVTSHGIHPAEETAPDENEDAHAATTLMQYANKDRQALIGRISGQLQGEAHEKLLSVHGDILSRTVPPQLTLELYQEVVPILGQCVKAYTSSLGRNHKLTAECIERHRECTTRLAHLQIMHEVPKEEARESVRGPHRH